MIDYIQCGYRSYLFMSFYSLGKNEIRSLQRQEKQMLNELDNLVKTESEKIRSFKAILLNNEIVKIQNKIKVLSSGKSFDGDDIA